MNVYSGWFFFLSSFFGRFVRENSGGCNHSTTKSLEKNWTFLKQVDRFFIKQMATKNGLKTRGRFIIFLFFGFSPTCLSM